MALRVSAILAAAFTAQSVNLNRNDTALIIVDPQHDFTQPNGSMPCIDTGPSSGIWTEIAELQAKNFLSVFVTRDWHPEDHVSFARNHPGAEPYSVISVPVVPNTYGPKPAVTAYNQTLWPAHCMQGSAGADFACPINPDALIVTKGTYVAVDSYSGFGDGVSAQAAYPKAKETSILKGQLDHRGVRELVVCGIATDYCVRATALDGIAYGYSVTLVHAACRGVNQTTIDEALQEMLAAGVRIVGYADNITLV